jgi:REP element-mobilizing transposase RayT
MATLFFDDQFKEMFLAVLVKTQQKYVFDLIFYEVLDNHIHLVIRTRPGEATISRIMQYLKARVAERFNKQTKTIGPFWNERFKDIIVEKQENPVQYLLTLLWCLSYNAVRRKLTSNPRNYKYGGINHYLDEYCNSPIKICLHEYFINIGGCFKERVEGFLELEKMYLSKIAFCER